MSDFEPKEIYTEKFGSIYVSKMDTAFPADYVAGGQVAPYYSAPSINNYRSLAEQAKRDYNMPEYANIILMNGHVSTDEEWITIKNNVNNSIKWIIGSLTSGGIGIVYAGAGGGYDTASFVLSYGLYSYTDPDTGITYEKIPITSSGNRLFIQFEEVGFVTWDNTNIYAFSHNVISASTKQTLEVKVLIGTDPIVGYTYSNTQTVTTGLASALISDYQSLIGHPDAPRIVLMAGYGIPQNDSWPIGSMAYTGDMGDYVATGDIWGGQDTEPDENSGGGISESGGGGGGFSNYSDGGTSDTSGQFSIDAINSGFVTIYNPNQVNIQAFCDYLFSDITEDIAIVLKRLVSNPLDYIISLNQVHFTPTTGESTEIKFCGLSTGVSAPRVTAQFKEIDCGSVHVSEQYNTFLDYGGYSRFKIYLPYCGIYPLDTNEIMGGYVRVKYIIDLLTGSCVAKVVVTRYRDYISGGDASLENCMMYEFTGNVFEQIPLSAIDYRGTIQGLMQIASGVSSVANGSGAGLGAVASGVMNLTPDVQHSGNAATSYGYMGFQKPYLILERPCQNQPYKFGSREGYVSNIYAEKLNNLTGYTEIDIESFKTEYIKCTDAERDELIKILGGGFII